MVEASHPDNCCADREDDDCSSAGSESCWGEMEDIGDDEVVEWGAMPPTGWIESERGDP